MQGIGQVKVTVELVQALHLTGVKKKGAGHHNLAPLGHSLNSSIESVDQPVSDSVALNLYSQGIFISRCADLLSLGFLGFSEATTPLQQRWINPPFS